MNVFILVVLHSTPYQPENYEGLRRLLDGMTVMIIGHADAEQPLAYILKTPHLIETIRDRISEFLYEGDGHVLFEVSRVSASLQDPTMGTFDALSHLFRKMDKGPG